MIPITPVPTDKQIDDLTTYQAGRIQATAHRNLLKQSDAILKRYDLTTTHWLIIGILYDAPNKAMRLTDLAKTLDTGVSYITTATNYLESKGMVSRQESDLDGRSKLISVTSKFVDQVSVIENELRDSLRQTFYNRVSTEDFHTYLRVLMQLFYETPA